MNKYQTRKINFKEIVKINDWTIKVYTIVKAGVFDSPSFYEQVKTELTNWLKLPNHFNSENDKTGFLILHQGTEGIFSIVNWWVGENMLNTHIFITKYDNLSNFKMISGNGLAPCIWELTVINHEKNAWVNHILKPLDKPNFEAYYKDILNVEI